MKLIKVLVILCFLPIINIPSNIFVYNLFNDQEQVIPIVINSIEQVIPIVINSIEQVIHIVINSIEQVIPIVINSIPCI